MSIYGTETEIEAHLINVDVLVIGGGLAGVTAGIKAKHSGVGKVALVSKGRLGKDSISTFAAGVFQPAFPEDDKDALMRMYASGDAWGGGLCDREWLKVYLEESFDRMLDMDQWGVEWEKGPDGEFERLKGRWGLPMAMFKGPQMMEALSRKVVEEGMDVIGHTMITDLLTERGEPGARVVGAIGFNVRNGEIITFQAKAVILAAGACAFKGRYIGHCAQTGDACAMAYRAGAKLGRFEIGDILHTTATTMDIQGLNMYTGLGGKFVNARGESFMKDYDPDLGDSASMARVAEASAMEVRDGKGPIYLDMTHFDPPRVRKLRVVLPLPSKVMQRAGVMEGDQIVQKMEWAPTFFGTIAAGGGVIANTRCETSIRGLFACGDAMARAKHFPKALSGAAVTGARAGLFAAEFAKAVEPYGPDRSQVEGLRVSLLGPLSRGEGMDADPVILGVQEALLPYEITVISRGDRLEKAISDVERLREEDVPLLAASDAHYLRVAHEVKSMVLVAEMYLKSRLLRTESRDACAREDYPYTDNIDWLKWTALREENGRMRLWTEDLSLHPGRNCGTERYLYPVFEVAKRKGIPWG
jgi:succinate dehydrogenase/fumarate reductase flavoprotein subunit